MTEDCRTKEERTCPECDGSGKIIVDLKLEKFRRKMGRIALLVFCLLSGSWCAARLWNGHVEIGGWVITFGAAFFAIWGDASE